MLNDNSTIKDLADVLDDLGASIRMRAQRTKGGTRFLTSVSYPGGTAMFSNLSLGGVLDASFAFLQLHELPRETVEADPDGVHIGPAPRPDPTGTSVGYTTPPPPLHCAVCGFGENPGEAYQPEIPCSNCDSVGNACPMEPGHESNHSLREDSGENRVAE